MRKRRILPALFIVLSLSAFSVPASDHSDAPSIGGLLRQDLNATDLHVFTVSDEGGEQHLVLSLCVDQAVPVPFPPGAHYLFPPDARFRFFIDNAPDPRTVPGSLHDIVEDITFEITFTTGVDQAGIPISVPNVKIHGMKSKRLMKVFAGERDDPFIRGPRQGKNVAAIVLQVPLAMILERGGPSLRVWGTIEFPYAHGNQMDLAGRALRSMGEIALNSMHPAFHANGADVVHIDVSLPSGFPNGRALTDDVVDLVGQLEPGVPGKDVRGSEGCGTPYTNCVTANESGFSDQFPYLQPAH